MKNIKAQIITIGDEILIGQIIDTNSAWLSHKLNKVGFQIVKTTSIPDEKESIMESLNEGLSTADLIIITGGLGPTKDDITKKTLAEFFNVELVRNEEVLTNVTQYFESRGKKMSPVQYSQADVPQNCEIIHNEFGTAPGMWFNVDGKVIISTPGVPLEMKRMMTNEALPKLTQHFNTGHIIHRTICTIGIGESSISEMIEEWESALPSYMRFAYLPRLGMVRLRLSASESKQRDLIQEVDEQITKLIPYIKKFIYSEEDTTIEKAINQMLIDNKKTIATAESCTGGYLAHVLTSISGSSAYFNGSVIAYQNEVKEKLLGVKKETLAAHGAVSEETVIEMATAIRKLLQTDIGVSTSGIAGPTGGTPEKPVGTVWIALSSEKGITTKKLQLGKEREHNIRLTTVAVLNLIRQDLSQEN